MRRAVRPAARRALQLLLTAACLGPAIVGAKPLVGLLAVDGPTADAAAALELSLPRAPALAGRWLVIGPAELSARLARAASVSARVDAARAHQQRAEQALAQMERRTALAASTSAVAALERVAGRLHVPEDLVRAWLAQAQARLLQPADEQGALRALRAALAINPALRVDLARFSPRVAGLLEQARAKLGASAPPTREELEQLCRHGAIPQLAWVRVRPGGGAAGGAVAVELLVYSRRGRSLAAQTTELSAAALSRQLPALVAAVLQRTLPAPASALASAPAAPGAPRQGAGRAPWYRRWWFWTAVGVAVVGAGVGIGLAASSKDGYELVVRF